MAIKYLKTALADFKNVASPLASSRFAARKVAAQLELDHKFVVEYGPGNGVMTKEVLKILPVDGKLVAIEINESFTADLVKINDDRLVVINGDVRELSDCLDSLGLPQVDAVVSGIPFSFFKKVVREEIVANTFAHLRPGGIFVVYQTTPALLPMLKKVFGKKVAMKTELRNFVPYFIMVAEKQNKL